MNTYQTHDNESAQDESTARGLSPSDEELMLAIQKRDGRALEMLLGRHRGLLRNVIMRVVNSHASADDTLQDCLVAIWNHADSYSAEKGAALAWLVTLAKRKAIDYLRREVSYGGAKARLEAETGAHTFEQNSDSEDSDMARVLQQHIYRLPEKQQEVVRLGFLDGRSQREVASLTKTPLGTVKTRMDLALKKLRVAFRHQGMSALQAG